MKAKHSTCLVASRAWLVKEPKDQCVQCLVSQKMGRAEIRGAGSGGQGEDLGFYSKCRGSL